MYLKIQLKSLITYIVISTPIIHIYIVIDNPDIILYTCKSYADCKLYDMLNVLYLPVSCGCLFYLLIIMYV